VAQAEEGEPDQGKQHGGLLSIDVTNIADDGGAIGFNLDAPWRWHC